jgi:hypothetical protein
MFKSARGVGAIVAVLGFAFLAGCGGPGVTREGPPAEAPAYRVGDRWVYKAQDGFRNPVVWEEVHEVTAMGAGGITVRITQQGPSVNTDRTEDWAAPGLVRRGAVFDAETRVFTKPLTRFAFPMHPGQSWREWVDNFNETTGRTGTFSRWVSVNGWGKVTTPAGSFDALHLRVSMRLDDDEFWREATQASYVLWYAPAVRATVREEKEAEYRERNAGPRAMPIRSQSAVMELVSFTPGKN